MKQIDEGPVVSNRASWIALHTRRLPPHDLWLKIVLLVGTANG
jgi:hypothetical protein